MSSRAQVVAFASGFEELILFRMRLVKHEPLEATNFLAARNDLMMSWALWGPAKVIFNGRGRRLSAFQVLPCCKFRHHSKLLVFLLFDFFGDFSKRCGMLVVSVISGHWAAQKEI
ncbi:unnamed protein product [Bursaphelenchus xylophilus]|uniref:(pine wood nematode) hypothetical protein n=1 Tax=Bursaphelenchus xylophilus TaxID=6326 RepID=A0A1I7S663_BURXY|nr:unnamed protein product [Bursaphelenchus xylophilus]CAG9081031.1 unnamed protein product [Bursaphelenchus xylophilus]